eukprot:CAMPEP_0179256402 /NCGR_PEP_ID=MMETSP0797-20121207/24250_1 /TAXON_ID=47934 /ORGANISM="Dinophysis acuminata, Strain DAEP01" /LENGTH=317 /DNA_ID=CAMNT_0020964339 /DNA_START=76 /DNA_END=1026 /DNA_ORIENTATION=-
MSDPGQSALELPATGGKLEERHASGRIRSVTIKSGTLLEKAKQKAELEEKRRKDRRKFIWGKAEDEAELVAEAYGAASWNHRVVTFWHQKRLQNTLLVLLAIDIAVVFIEIFLEAHFPSCSTITRDAVSCCMPAPALKVRRLGGGGGSGHDLCAAPLHASADQGAGCDDHKHAGVHTLHTVCFAVSVCILSLFEVELLTLAAAMRTLFIKNLCYMADLLVVTASLAIELHMNLSEHASGESAALLLIFARCWRFIRIGHGIVLTAHEHDMDTVKDIAELAKELQEEVDGLEKEVELLEARLAEHEGTAASRGRPAGG